MSGQNDRGDMRVIAENRKARHDYFVEETVEAGLVLTGTEIKSVRAGRVNLRDSHARIERGEVVLYGTHIAPYEHGNRYNHDPDRPRKLLLRRDQIARLAGAVRRRGYTLVPLRLYLRRGWAKVELALARGKKSYDKRQAIAEREARRQVDRALKA
ncbi:MAG: SsrA-binding protein SmpB, partial [Clostridia bacterium]|nr:SsrA-binding protein SmpB [Clostridia bacterium]